jgi:hypothetical protein
MMALSSALLFIVFLAEDFGGLMATLQAELPWGLVLRYLVAMAAGGALCGALLSGLFGRQGLGGWLLAGLGGIVTATIAGMLGSLLGLLPDLLADGWQTRDLVAVGAGALVLPLAATGWTPLLALWAAVVGGTHIRVRRLRS